MSIALHAEDLPDGLGKVKTASTPMTVKVRSVRNVSRKGASMKRKTEKEVRASPFDLEKWKRNKEDFDRRHPIKPGFMLCLDGTWEKVPKSTGPPALRPSRGRRYTRPSKESLTTQLLMVVGLLTGSLIEAPTGVTTLKGTVTALHLIWFLYRKEAYG